MKIIFIAGYGHVGSTILEYYLNKHKEIFALGESKHLKYSQNMICSCKKRLSFCNFWKKILKKKFYILEGFVDHKISRIKYCIRLVLINFEKKKINPYKRLDFYLRRRKINFLIDNSKDPLALIDCIKKNKNNNVKVIFLKREILKVIKSYKNKKRQIKKLDQKNPLVTFCEYFINNALTKIILKIYNISYIEIENYDLRKKPNKTINRIFNFLNIHHKSFNLKKKIKNKYHSLEGNVLRFKLKN